MRGTIQQRGSSWRIRAYVGRDSTGKKSYVSRTVRGTRRDAEKDLSRLLVEVDEGRHVASPSMTLDDMTARWLEVKRIRHDGWRLPPPSPTRRKALGSTDPFAGTPIACTDCRRPPGRRTRQGKRASTAPFVIKEIDGLL